MKRLIAAIGFALISAVGTVDADVVTVTNGDFETGPFGVIQPITGWDEDEGTGGTTDANYAEAIAFTGNTTNHLYMKANTNNWVGQTFGGVDATTSGDYTIDFVAGMRTAATPLQTDHGFNITSRIALWNLTTGNEVAGQDITINNPGAQGPNTFSNYSVNLTYDNLAQTAGDNLQLRITHAGPAEADLGATLGWQATAVFDNVSVNNVVAAVPEPSSLFVLAGVAFAGMVRRRRG